MKTQVGTIFGEWETGRNVTTGTTFTTATPKDAFVKVVKDGGKVGHCFMWRKMVYVLTANDSYVSGIGYRMATIAEMGAINLEVGK